MSERIYFKNGSGKYLAVICAMGNKIALTFTENESDAIYATSKVSQKLIVDICANAGGYVVPSKSRVRDCSEEPTARSARIRSGKPGPRNEGDAQTL